MPDTPIFVNGRKFASREEALASLNAILGSARLGYTLPPDKFSYVVDFLARHPRVSEKIGCGVVAICVIRHPNFPQMRCFAVIRSDRTLEIFSAVKCVYAR